MTYFDFDQEATVSTQAKLLLGGIGGGIGETHPFPTLREALTFVAGMSAEERARTWVMTDAHTYHGEAIDELMNKLAEQSTAA